MKSWHVVVLSLVLGLGLGVGITRLRVHLAPWDGTPEGVRGTRTEPVPSLEKAMSREGPKVAVDKETHECGVVESQVMDKHSFQISNVGTKALTLTKGETSCKCTVSALEKTGLQPGESTKVILEWTPKVEGPFRHSATITTNDPSRPRLTLIVSGRAITAVKSVPAEIAFTSVAAGEPTSQPVQILGYVPDRLRIDGYELLEPQFADHFEIKLAPMTPAQLAEEKDAKSGYSGHVTVKPGLPTGTFRQTIRVKTGIKTSPKLDLLVQGKVVSDLSVAGAGFDSDLGILMVDNVSSREGAERRLLVLARGPHHKEVKLKPKEIWPDLLKVEIGQATELPGRPVSQTLIAIRIPKGSPPANHLGSEQGRLGRILLETGLPPPASSLIIRVRFAVQD